MSIETSEQPSARGCGPSLRQFRIRMLSTHGSSSDGPGATPPTVSIFRRTLLRQRLGPRHFSFPTVQRYGVVRTGAFGLQLPDDIVRLLPQHLAPIAKPSVGR